MSDLASFRPARIDNVFDGMRKDAPGPLCECQRRSCNIRLPREAWAYATAGQYVVAPSHKTAGARFYGLEGFVVEEAS